MTEMARTDNRANRLDVHVNWGLRGIELGERLYPASLDGLGESVSSEHSALTTWPAW